MQNIKNFRPYVPGEEVTALYSEPGTPPTLFLMSEDGLDWYECQSLFADDTVKIMYDSAGVIVGLIDKPVPERGNTLAVSMFFPDGMSVAEVKSVPDGCANDGGWMFDGSEVVAVPVDYVAQAEKQKSQLMSAAEAAIAPLKRAVKYSMATDAEKASLEQWEVYTVLLIRVDTSKAPDIEWPPVPVNNNGLG
ncbi:tail fiber assembly protein [Enterobacter kobei]|nr:tail fiber assembly protein [Enterobacter kobei]